MNVITEYLVRLINFVSPKKCTICGCRLSIGEEVMCYACNAHLPRTHFSKDPYENYMAKLFWGQIPIEKATALFFYEPRSEVSRIIHSMKYFDHPETGESMGRIVAEEVAADGFFNGIDAIVPIPLAKKRQRQRGYNQSHEIAIGIRGVTKLPILNRCVKRKTFSMSQTKMNRPQRMENVEEAFELLDAQQIAGKHILIVDDVVTTGATVISCARELAKAGGVRFSVLSLGMTKP